MAGCLVYSSIASTRSGVGLGARGATRVKLGPPNSDINSMRSRAAARDTTPERAGVSEMSRVAGRAMLSLHDAAVRWRAGAWCGTKLQRGCAQKWAQHETAAL